MSLVFLRISAYAWCLALGAGCSRETQTPGDGVPSTMGGAQSTGGAQSPASSGGSPAQTGAATSGWPGAGGNQSGTGGGSGGAGAAATGGSELGAGGNQSGTGGGSGGAGAAATGGSELGAGGSGGHVDGIAAQSDSNMDAGSTGAPEDDPLAVDVYLIAGQSNATGQGYMKNVPSDFVIPDTITLFHSSLLISGATPNSWIPLQQASESPDRFGPELGFGAQIQSLYPQRKVAIIKHAVSNTNLYSQWAPGTDSNNRSGWGAEFSTFVDTVTDGLDALTEDGLHPNIRATLWQQGEADADSGGANAENYGKNLAAFIARVREQFEAPEMLFIYGYVYPPPAMSAAITLVRNGQAAVDQDSGNALAVNGAFVIPTDDLQQRADDPETPYPNDRIHFGSAGQLELGRRMADKVAEQLAR